MLHVENNLVTIFNLVPGESAQARSPRDARRQQTRCAAAAVLLRWPSGARGLLLGLLLLVVLLVVLLLLPLVVAVQQ